MCTCTSILSGSGFPKSAQLRLDVTVMQCSQKCDLLLHTTLLITQKVGGHNNVSTGVWCNQLHTRRDTSASMQRNAMYAPVDMLCGLGPSSYVIPVADSERRVRGFFSGLRAKCAENFY